MHKLLFQVSILTLSLVVGISSIFGQTRPPITKEDFISSIKLGKKEHKKAESYIARIKELKVDFILTQRDKQALRRYGSYLGKNGLDDLITAVRENRAVTPVRVVEETARSGIVSILAQEQIASIKPEFPYALRVVIRTDIRVQPVSLIFRCDGEISDGFVSFAGEEAIIFFKMKIGVFPNRSDLFLAMFESPALLPEKAMILTLFSKTSIRVVEMSATPFVFP